MKTLVSRFRGSAEPVPEPRPALATALSSEDAREMCAAFEALGLGSYWSTDAETRLTYLSPSARGVLGIAEGENPPAQSFANFFAAAGTLHDNQRTLAFALAKKVRFERVIARIERGEGSWWAISAVARRDSTGAFSGFCGIMTDVTAELATAEESAQLAMNDPLTGLLNRRHMTQLLDRTIAAYAPTRRPCATMLIDLDRFKHVNDTLGHVVGDELLKLVSERLVQVIGNKEKVCRLGGDEFQVLLPDVDDRGKLGEVAQAVINALSEPYAIDGNRCIIGATVGVAISPFDGETSLDLVRNADLALYAAKHSGRGRYRFYSGELLASAEERRQLEEDLHDALQRGEFQLYYQPVVNSITGKVCGAEALIRWFHPQRGPISPALFIPIAEETAMIGKIGEWTLRQACEEAVRWPDGIRVAVNVSPVQFSDAHLPRIVAHALASSGLAPERLELEITEGVFLQEGSATNNMFNALKGLGVRLALDDFGTGYSSLGYLKSAPFDKIKIDQSFVRGATGQEPRNKAIIGAIVALAEALGMETTAEGIESFDQLEMIRALRVSHVQGYIYAKPMPGEDFRSSTSEESWAIEPSGPARQRHERMAMFRNIGAVHEDHYYPCMLRNLSTTGALIEGIMDVPTGTRFVLDFGEGQLVVGTVRRSKAAHQGIEFDTPLVSDGNGGLCTRQRILPHHLAAAGIPENPNEYMKRQVSKLASGKISMPRFAVHNRGGTIVGSNRKAKGEAPA